MNAMRARSWPRCGRTPGTSLAPTFRTRGTASCDPDCVRPQRRKFRLEWRCSLRLSDLYVEAWHICANGSEQNCTVLLLLWAMRTVTGLGTPRFTSRPKAGYAGFVTPAGGFTNAKKTLSACLGGAASDDDRHANCGANQEGGFEHAQGGRHGAGLHAKTFRRHRPQRREVKRLPWQEERRAGVLHLRFYRWLNAANEKLPAEPESAGSSRHPGPGCEHG